MEEKRMWKMSRRSLYVEDAGCLGWTQTEMDETISKLITNNERWGRSTDIMCRRVEKCQANRQQAR